MADPAGNYNTYNYSTNSGIFQLMSVTDADSNQTSLYYTNLAFPNQITSVVDPFSRTNLLSYDANGYLTNSVDVAGLSSSFKYDASEPGWITNLVTSYGATGFSFGGVDVNTNLGDAGVDRYALITLPTGGKHLYLYMADCTSFLGSWSPTVPSTTPFTNTFEKSSDGTYPYLNSFYWGPLQYETLSTNNIMALNSADYANGRFRHWLQLTNPGTHEPSTALSIERAPSPGGTTQGQLTWYDYEDKGNDYSQGGISDFPSFVAQVLPDTSTHFSYSLRGLSLNVTNEVSTYSAPGGVSVALRTNIYYYAANAIDLLQWVGPQGEQVVSNYFLGNPTHEPNASYDALNEGTLYTYNSYGQVTSIQNPAGLTTTNIYYSSGSSTNRLATSIDLQILRTNSYTYYSNGLLDTHTDERGLTTTNFWDNLQRMTGMSYPDGSTISNLYTYLDITGTKDRLGRWSHYGYNAIRQKIAETNVNGTVTGYSYCDCGLLYSVTNAWNTTAQMVTSYTYDNQGNRLITYLPNTAITNFYDALGRVITNSDAWGFHDFGYNNQGLRIGMGNTYGVDQAIYFDIEDRPIYVQDGNQVTVTNTYDLLGRLSTRLYPDGGLERFGYSPRGLTAYTNQLNLTNYYGYDAAGRRTTETNANWEIIRYTNNAAGDLLSLTDGKGQTTSWNYDSYGRVTNKLDQTGAVILTYNYDANNRLTNRWSAAKTNTVYKYDAVGNLTNVVYPVSAQIKLYYDAMNRLTNMVDGVGTTAYGYDAIGELLSEGGLWPNDAVSYTYTNRLRTGLSVQAPNASAWTEGYGYDSARRLTSLSSPAGTFGYIYDPARLQRVDQLNLPNSAYITNYYDNVARLLGTSLKSSGNSSLDSYAYGYNQASQRTNVARTAGDYVNYTYDNMGELKAAIGKESGGMTNRWQEQFGYAYDAAGDLNQRTNYSLIQTFSVNSLNELTTITNAGKLTVAGTTTSPATNVTVNTSNAVLYADITFASTNQPWASGNNTFTAIARDVYGRINTNSVAVNLLMTNGYSYDLNGNLLSDGTRYFAYDDENQMISVTVSNMWQSQFAYDGKMRRRIERDYNWNGSSWTQTNEVHFIYDGNVVVQERNTNNLPQVTYTRGNDLSGTLQGAGGIGGLLARTDNSQLILGNSSAHAYYHTDGNGNVTAMINNLQLIVAKYLYDSFGNTLSLSGPLAGANTYRFSSKEWNDNAGLYYYLYRFYDPNLQRWLNRDPIQEWGGINLYGYVYNDSINLFDLFGLTTYVSNTPFPWTPPCQKGPYSYTIDDGHNGTETYTLSSPWPESPDSSRLQNKINNFINQQQNQSSQSQWNRLTQFGSNAAYTTVASTTIGGLTGATPGSINNRTGYDSTSTGLGPQLNVQIGNGVLQVGGSFSLQNGGFNYTYPLSHK